MQPAPARRAAFATLLRVESGAYASDVLRAQALDPRDAGLASEIVFGVLRFRAQLDHLLTHYGAPRKLDPEVRTALRMAVYQLRYLERIPPHAAVADAVELVIRARKRSASGLVNAILRKVNRDPVEWPTREVALSCPEWLLARWEIAYGIEAAESIAGAALEEPVKYTRGDRIQDIGAQSVIPLLRLEPGQSFLDLCAAPGNKTAQALESNVHAIACDLHFHRARDLKNVTPNVVVLDGTRPLPFARSFDRILVDAPCTGTGTLARNPEIKWRLTAAGLEELPRLQRALLAQARAALATNGVLVYATCSLEWEENEQIISEIPADLVIETMQRLPGRDPGDGFFAAVIRG